MTKISFGRLLISGVLLVILIGLLITYFAVVNTLPTQIYTDAQQEYLNYNYSRSVSQKAPVLNIVQQGDQAAAMLPIQDSRVRATLAARYEEQEGVSVTVYDLDFQGEYHLVHTGSATNTIELFFPFPNNLETLHEVRFLVDDEEPANASYTTRGISWQVTLPPGEEHQVIISYQADGANRFSYGLPQDQRVNVDIVVTVLGLPGSEVPRAFLPTTSSKVTNEGEIFNWQYPGLIADRDIQLILPTRLSFTQRVAQLQDDFSILAGLAPFLVGIFLVTLFGVLRQSRVQLRSEGYLLIGCGLALFYPLLTFLSGLVGATLAAILALLLVSSLLLFFLGLAVGWRKIWWRVSLLLFIFLGIFSLGMLTPWRGLLLTMGGLLLVGIFMLLYARRPPPAEDIELALPSEKEALIKPESPLPLTKPEPVSPPAKEPPTRHCPYCARALADDYHFCPGCGHETASLRRCPHCAQAQFVPPELEQVYCLHCGQKIN
ncbi:MAG: zinc ribbon domain-containing protein [Anaerolineae bacterium]|nr:zinc ribbon domain-containing protein [Anaerolineae bacterium]